MSQLRDSGPITRLRSTRPASVLRIGVDEARAVAVLARQAKIGVEPPSRIAGYARDLVAFGVPGAIPAIAAARYGNRTAVIDELGSLSYRDLNLRANSIANALASRGLTSDHTVGLLCRNHRGLLDALFACAKLGTRTLLLNTDFAGPQVTDVCAREDVSMIVYDEEFAEVVAGASVRFGRYVAWQDDPGSARDCLDLLRAMGSPKPPPKPASQMRLVLLTSGTTGTPKGAPRHMSGSLTIPGALLERVPWRNGDRVYIAPPIFHALGLATSMVCYSIGATIVMRRRFDAVAALEEMERDRCNGLVVIPVMLSRLMSAIDEAGDETGAPTPPLRVVLSSGSQLPAELATRAMDRLGDVLYNLYGSTEVAYATIATPADLRAAPGCVGRTALGAVVRLVDDAGEPVPQGQTGRIFVGSRAKFEAYTDGSTKAVVAGLMSSGDVGHFDEHGRLWVDGRDDEMIVSGGENQFPREIEELLVRHPQISDVAAIGVDDETYGQRLKAFVVKTTDGAELDEDGVKTYVKQNLARYKVPREVVFLDELPRNPAGKILKRKLADWEA